MFAIIKMTIDRIVHHKIYLLMSVFVTPLVVFGAVFFTNNVESIKAHIAVLQEDQLPIESKDIKVTTVETEPPFSELVSGKYDAVIKKVNGEYEIQTVKGEEFKERLVDYAKGNRDAFSKTDRGIAANFIGFMTMFILLFCSMLYKFYYSEKNGINKRILASKIGFIEYAISHASVVFLIVFIPAILTVLLARATIGFATTVSNIELFFILFVLCMMSTSFNLVISAIFKTEANGSLVGAMIILLTTLIAGSMFEVSKGGVIQQIANFLPQKHILDFTIQLENTGSANYMNMLWIILLSILVAIIGITIDKRRMKQHD